MLALCKVRDSSSQMSEWLNFLMQCAEKEDKKWEREERKGKKTQLLGTKWEKPLAPRAVAAEFLRSASVQGVTFAVRSSLLSPSSSS